MNYLCSVVFVLLFCVGILSARVFIPQQTYWRYQAFGNPKQEAAHAHTLWAYYSGSSSKKAFGNNGKKGCAQLADIFFNKATFLASDVAAPVTNVAVNALFSPRFTYRQQGIDIGYYGSWRINKNWSWGVLAELPLKEVTVKSQQLFSPSSAENIQFFGQPLSSVFQQTQATTGDQTYTTYAYRLDFLSQLPYACTGVGLEYPLTVYHDTDFINLPLTLSNVDTTDANNNPVTLLYAQPGTLPTAPYALVQSDAMALTPLQGNGAQTGTDQRERIASGVDYSALGLLPANQELWWVVPTLIPVTGGQTTVFPARVIRDHVDEVVACFTAQAQNIFKQAGISFASQKMWGAGDLITQLFVTYHDDAWWGLRARCGVVFPTGKKAQNVTKVFQQPLGNNGHYELQVGAEFLVDVPHCSAMIYCLESHAFKRKEAVPTAFLGSCVKNIGLCSSADIAWDTVSAGILASLYATNIARHTDIIIGYNVMVKSHDRVDYNNATAYTIYSTLQTFDKQPLDNQVLMQKTEQQAHTIQLQLRSAVGATMRIDGGFEYTFAGKTAPVVWSWNIGLAALF